MQWKLCLAVGALVMLGACKESNLPSRLWLGAFNMNAIPDPGGSGEFSTRPTGVFFDATSNPGGPIVLPDSRVVVDSCTDRPFPQRTFPAVLQQVDAGSPVTIQTDKATSPMILTGQNGVQTYVIPGNGDIDFTPGSDVTFSIPGSPDGFPAMTITGRTAAPLVLGPIDPNPPDDPGLVLTWNALADSNAVVVSLQFASSDTAAAPNVEIYCSLHDDGTETLPPRLTQLWKGTKNEIRHVHAFRWRTTTKRTDISGDVISQAIIISQFDVDRSTFP